MKCLKYSFLLLLFPVFLLFPHSTPINNTKFINYGKDSIHVNLRSFYKNGYYVINKTIDLKGKTWYLPKDISLVFDGGLIRNGTIKGNNTNISAKGVVFDKVHIEGKWNVPVISTSLFADLSYVNSLKDVFALANPEIDNTIYIGYGTYMVTANYNFDRCIEIVSNSDVTIDGDVLLTPNAYPEYSMLFLRGDNIVLKGNGLIAGDKFTHLNDRGEWGMGIHIQGGNNVLIKQLTIKNCWGDCIYIGGESRNIDIEECVLDNGRRQGISVVSASEVRIINCSISNVSGTSPQYAVDIEPNAGNIVDSVFVSNVKVFNCQGGIMSHGKAENAEIGFIELNKCIVVGTKLCPLYFVKGREVQVKDCKIIDSDTSYMIVCNDVDSVTIERNTIYKNEGKISSEQSVTVNRAKIKTINNNIVY